MKKKRKTSLFRMIYIGATILVIVLVGIFDPSIKNLAVAFEQLSLNWLIACIGCLLLYWFTDGILLHDVTSYMYKREPLRNSVKIGMVGLYYGALTPFATGGQPMQVVYMRRSKMPLGTATCIVCIKFVVYELSLCTFYVVAMLFRGSYFYTNHNQVFWLTTLGFLVNVIAVAFILLTIRNKKLVLNIGGFLIRLLNKIKIIKNKEEAMVGFEKTIDDYHTAAGYISKYKLRVVGSYLISAVNLAFFFAIPYFIYLAFGHTLYTLIDLITMQAFLYLAVSFFPMPGAAGAAEGGFYLFFSTFFVNIPVYIAMLIWRFLTYYLMLIVGSIIVVLDEVFAIRRLKREEAEEE